MGLLLLAGGAALWRWKHPREVTYARDIAPITLTRCAPCHRPGEAAPFSLLTYEDLSRRAAQIRKVVSRRLMPPWKPTPGGVPGAVAFKGDRSLTDAQINLILRWIDAGAPLGDRADLPPAPVWPTGWQLGEPDVTVEFPEAYRLRAEGKDVYRNFLLPAPVTGTHYVTAWEFRPGTRVIHHAILNIDRLGLARARDRADGEMGFDGMDAGNAQSADGFYLVWAPGMTPAAPNPARSWRVDEHTDLVVQLHMQPRGKEEAVRPVIGLYFGDRPPTEHLVSLRIGDAPIDIAPGEARFVMRDEFTLPTAVDAVSLFPHAHYLARTFRSWATLPDRSVRDLLRIDAWDFNWQDAYTYATPISLPAGATLSMEVVYDNSDDNPHNPNHPPRRVRSGEKSTDEMGNITFEVVAREKGGDAKLRVAKYTRWLAASDIARNHYNLANALADDGRVDEAMAHYLRAIAEDPTLAPAEFNLANLLVARHDVVGAIAHFQAALAAKPDHGDARLNLGHAFEAAGRIGDAIATYRELIARDPTSAFAHASLGVALAREGDRAAAMDELALARKLAPGDAQIQAALNGLAAKP